MDKTLEDVRNFWYPLPPKEDGTSEPIGRGDYLNDMAYINGRMKEWFFGDAEFDGKCRAFRELIRSSAAEHEKKKDDLLTSITKIIMFDQIARNAFRREPEAFAYEDYVIDILEDLFDVKDDKIPITEEALSAFVNKEGVTLRDCLFVAVSMQHQEKPSFHGADGRMHKYLIEKWPENKELVAGLKAYSEDHHAVLKRFGRYPHRNAMKGREDTPEEREWLNDYDNLPGWAKSQLPAPSK